MSYALFFAAALIQAPAAAPAPPAPARDTLRIYAVGDINLGRNLAKTYLQRGDTLYPFAQLLDTLRAADLTFGNLESPIAPDTHKVEGEGVVFTAPGIAARSLAEAGFDIVSTANNHAWDGGQASVFETMRRLTAAGVLFVGSGMGRPMAQQPVIVRVRGWRVGFFAVTRAWNPAPYAFYQHAGANYIAWGDPRWIYPAIKRLKGVLASLPIETNAGTFMAHYSAQGLAELDFPSGKPGKSTPNVVHRLPDSGLPDATPACSSKSDRKRSDWRRYENVPAYKNQGHSHQ